MIADLMPGGVASVEAFDDAQLCVLFPAEEAVISRAMDERRREFTTARWCAREALARLGYPPVPVLPGARGAPVWPVGVVGSITHCAGYRAAAVARTSAMATLGVDAEPNAPLPPGVLETVAVDEELEWVAELLRDDPSVRWDRVLFSAKESVYKAWFPLARRWLDFRDTSIMIDPTEGRFHAGLLSDGPVLRDRGRVRGFSGRWLVRRQLLVTAIAMPAAAVRDVGATDDFSGASST